MANTFSGLWDELKTEALNTWQAIKNDIVSLEHTLVPVVEQDIALVLSQFKGVAVQMIMTLAQAEFANLSGTQKNAITVATIVNSAKAAGKQLAIQDAQLLAQQAFNALVSNMPK